MADSKISALTEATTLAGTDEFVIASAGASKRVTFTTLGNELGAGASFWDDEIVKASDETISATTTLQNDNDFSFAVTAQPYYFELFLVYDSPSAADIKHAFAISAGTFTRAWRVVDGYFNTATLTASTGIQGDMTTALPAGSNATESIVIRIYGYFLPSTSATVNFQWAQNVSDGGNTIVKAGSVLHYRALV